MKQLLTLGHNPSESFITSFYDDYYGNKNKANSHFSNWQYGIWAHYSNIPTEAMCAFKCYIDTVEHCSFYFFGNNHCQVGHYNYRGRKISGSVNSNTKYMVRKDLSKYLLGRFPI